MRLESLSGEPREPLHDVRIVLSRRNLKTLLAKLDGHPPNSECTIGMPPIFGDIEVTAEEDGPHYDNPIREEVRGLAGAMHPETEAAIRESNPMICSKCGGPFSGPGQFGGCVVMGTEYSHFPECPK